MKWICKNNKVVKAGQEKERKQKIFHGPYKDAVEFFLGPLDTISEQLPTYTGKLEERIFKIIHYRQTSNFITKMTSAEIWDYIHNQMFSEMKYFCINKSLQDMITSKVMSKCIRLGVINDELIIKTLKRNIESTKSESKIRRYNRRLNKILEFRKSEIYDRIIKIENR